MSKAEQPARPQRVAIIGAGAIGSYYGARLAEAGHDVHFLMRRDYEAVSSGGLRVTSISGDFVLEARVNMAATFGASDPDWQPPRVGHEYGLEIVHCDPDGGSYGGHFILYGTGDDDATWARAILSVPLDPIQRDAQ